MLWGFFRPSAIGVFEPDRERGAETRTVSRGAREKNKREINFVRSPTFFFSALRSERTNERSKNVGRTTTTTKTDWKTSREGAETAERPSRIESKRTNARSIKPEISPGKKMQDFTVFFFFSTESPSAVTSGRNGVAKKNVTRVRLVDGFESSSKRGFRRHNRLWGSKRRAE